MCNDLAEAMKALDGKKSLNSLRIRVEARANTVERAAAAVYAIKGAVPHS